MRPFRVELLLPLAAIAIAAALGGCAFGQKSRDQTLLPALRLAAGGVEHDARSGIGTLPAETQGAATVEVDRFFAAIRLDPPGEEAQLLWPAVAALAESGIQSRLESGTIGPHVAGSLRERLARFGEGISTYFREES